MKKEKIALKLADDFFIRMVIPEDINEDYLQTLLDQDSLIYMGRQKPKCNLDSLKKYVRDQYNSQENYLFGLYKDGYLVATSRIHTLADKEIWQGILVFKKFRKQGYGQFLVKTVSDYVLKSFETPHIYAGILQKNLRSQKLFEQSGFTHLMDDPHDVNRQIWAKESA